MKPRMSQYMLKCAPDEYDALVETFETMAGFRVTQDGIDRFLMPGGKVTVWLGKESEDACTFPNERVKMSVVYTTLMPPRYIGKIARRLDGTHIYLGSWGSGKLSSPKEIVDSCLGKSRQEFSRRKSQ